MACVLEESDGHVRLITLNRPQSFNALDSHVADSLTASMKRAAADPEVRAVVITGSGEFFCGGADLSAPGYAHQEGMAIPISETLKRHHNELVRAMVRCPLPVIAAVNGPAGGEGLSIALACDLRVASERAFFEQTFVHAGMVPNCGSTFMLSRIVGLARAIEMSMVGCKVTAAEALRIGLINRIVSAGDLIDEAIALAQALARYPTRSIAQMKRAFYGPAGLDFDVAVTLETELQMELESSSAHRQDVEAFLFGPQRRIEGLL